MDADKNRSYSQINPSSKLNDFVDSYWEHKNISSSPIKMSIFPDSFFKVIVFLIDGKITKYFITGLWPKVVEFDIPAGVTIYGIRFKILAPEYLFQQEFAHLKGTHQNLALDFWNIQDIKFTSFQEVVNQIETILLQQLNQNKKIDDKKVQLSQVLYQLEGDASAKQISTQIGWERQQISRYLNKYLGVSLKKYLNIQKCYASYIHIREGNFSPEKDFYDQAHFIREIKKHTGKTPRELYKNQNDRFIQLRDIQKK